MRESCERAVVKVVVIETCERAVVKVVVIETCERAVVIDVVWQLSSYPKICKKVSMVLKNEKQKKCI